MGTGIFIRLKINLQNSIEIITASGEAGDFDSLDFEPWSNGRNESPHIDDRSADPGNSREMKLSWGGRTNERRINDCSTKLAGAKWQDLSRW